MQLEQQLAAMHQALAASHQEIMGSKLREAHLAGQLHELEQQVMQAALGSPDWLHQAPVLAFGTAPPDLLPPLDAARCPFACPFPICGAAMGSQISLSLTSSDMHAYMGLPPLSPGGIQEGCCRGTSSRAESKPGCY